MFLWFINHKLIYSRNEKTVRVRDECMMRVWREEIVKISKMEGWIKLVKAMNTRSFLFLKIKRFGEVCAWLDNKSKVSTNGINMV